MRSLKRKFSGIKSAVFLTDPISTLIQVRLFPGAVYLSQADGSLRSNLSYAGVGLTH